MHQITYLLKFSLGEGAPEPPSKSHGFAMQLYTLTTSICFFYGSYEFYTRIDKNIGEVLL